MKRFYTNLILLSCCAYLEAGDYSQTAGVALAGAQEVAEGSMAQLKRMAEAATSRAERAEESVSRLEQRATFLEEALKVLRAFPDIGKGSKYSRALKISAVIGGGILTSGGGFLAYRYDVYGIGSLVGSYGSWWQGIKNWLGIRRIEQTQGEHTTMLTSHGEHLGRISQKQKEQSTVLDTHGRQLCQVTMNQEQHTSALAAQGLRLRRMEQWQNEQSQAVKQLGAQVEHVRKTQTEHGLMLKNHGEGLEKFNGEQERQSKALREMVQNIFQLQRTLSNYGRRLETIQDGVNGVGMDIHDEMACQLRPIQQQMSALQGDLCAIRRFVDRVSQSNGSKPATASTSMSNLPGFGSKKKRGGARFSVTELRPIRQINNE